MRTTVDQAINEQTKKAWELNWEDISMETIMEIFKYDRVQKHVEILMRHLPKEGKMIEAGCGLCPYLLFLRAQSYDVLGVDYNARPLEKVRRHYPETPLVVQDVSRLGFCDEVFSGYLSFGVIEHFTEGPEAALQEASRVLKEGGIAVISVPQKSIFAQLMTPVEQLKKLVKFSFRMKSPKHYWEQYFDVQELKATMEEFNLKVRHIYPLDHDRSLLAFGNCFRDRKSFDEMSPLAIKIGRWLNRYAPFLTCSAVMYIAEKQLRP